MREGAQAFRTGLAGGAVAVPWWNHADTVLLRFRPKPSGKRTYASVVEETVQFLLGDPNRKAVLLGDIPLQKEVLADEVADALAAAGSRAMPSEILARITFLLP